MFFILALGTVTLHGQFKLGFRAGATVNTVDESNANFSGVDYSYRHYSGVNFGLFTDLLLTEHSSVEFALEITQRGYREDASYVSDSLAFNQETEITYFYTRLPLLYKHHFSLKKGRIFAKGGMYLGVGLGGRYLANPDIYLNRTGIDYINESYERGVVFAASLHSQALTNAFYGADLYLNRFDYGATFGLGYRYKKLVVDLSYDLGLRNMVPPSAVPIYTNNLRYYNRSIILNVGLYF